MAMMIKIRRWPARHWPFPLYFQVECLTVGEPSHFLDDDDDFVDFAEDLAILAQEAISLNMAEKGELPSKEESPLLKKLREIPSGSVKEIHVSGDTFKD